jgi:putative multiple sugar transport system substrate-binding protein
MLKIYEDLRFILYQSVLIYLMRSCEADSHKRRVFCAAKRGGMVMKRKVIGMMLSLALVVSTLAGCGSTGGSSTSTGGAASTESKAPSAAESATPSTTETASAGRVGVAMPTKDLQRWNQDGENMKSELEKAGYEVDLQYANNDIGTQVSQVETLITNGCQVLVIASVNGESLGEPLAKAKEAGISVIAYDRLLMNSDAVTYYATFDNYMVGQKQGEYIKEKLDLDNAAGPFNMEIFTGDPGDNNANFFYNGAMDILRPYIDSGKIVVPSGSIEFAEVATADWDTAKAQSRMDAILASHYANGEKLDAVLCSNDSTALGVENALAAYTGAWPIITGQDCDIANVKNIIAGKQSMSIFKDTRELAAQTVKMVDAIMQGKEAEVNDTTTYDNGTGIIPTYLCDPVFADINNYKELLIDSGYYTEEQLQ